MVIIIGTREIEKKEFILKNICNKKEVNLPTTCTPDQVLKAINNIK
jgi:hypothetical protein